MIIYRSYIFKSPVEMGGEESIKLAEHDLNSIEKSDDITALPSVYNRLVKQSSAIDCEISNEEFHFDQQLINIGKLQNNTESGCIFDNYDTEQLDKYSTDFKRLADNLENFIYQCGDDSCAESML